MAARVGSRFESRGNEEELSSTAAAPLRQLSISRFVGIQHQLNVPCRSCRTVGFAWQ